MQRHQGLSIHSDNLNTFSRILQNVYLTYIAVNKQGLTTPRQMSVPFFFHPRRLMPVMALLTGVSQR